MGKVYSLGEYRIRRELRELRERLTARIEYCEKNGYFYLDHYTIKQLHEKIGTLNQKLQEMKNEGSA